MPKEGRFGKIIMGKIISNSLSKYGDLFFCEQAVESCAVVRYALVRKKEGRNESIFQPLARLEESVEKGDRELSADLSANHEECLAPASKK